MCIYIHAGGGNAPLPFLRLWLLFGTRALAPAAVGSVLGPRLNLSGVDCKKLGYPIAHDVVLFKAAVFAAVNLNHAAVVHLCAYDAADLQHLKQLQRELEAAALARLRTVGADIAEVMRPHGQQQFNAGVFDVEWKLELLLQQADCNLLKIKIGRACDAGSSAHGRELVDDALQLIENGFDVGRAGLNLNLAELAGAVAEEYAGQCLALDRQRKIARVLHVGGTTCDGNKKNWVHDDIMQLCSERNGFEQLTGV